MADWNTSSSRNKNALERLLDDPKKVTAAVVGLGALLIGVWALTFLDRKEDPEQGRVAFSLPDPQKALPPVGSGMLVAKAAAPQAARPADREADALKSLQDEAAKEVADAPAEAGETPDDPEIPVEGEDENGAPGRPLAEQAGWLGGSGGGSAGGGGFVPSASGGAAGGAGSGASMQAGVGPGTAVADAGAGARQVQGAAGSGRAVSGGGARSIRSGTIGGANGAAGPGVTAAAGSRFAPSGTSGSAYSAGPGVSGGSPVGGGGATVGGGGAGMRPEGGGGGVDNGPGGNPDVPTGGGGDKNPPDNGGPGPDKDVKAKKRAEVNQDAAEVLKTAKNYRTNVVVKIMAEEKLDVAQVGARSKQANLLLKADSTSLQKAEAKLAAFPAAVESLSGARGLLAEVLPRFAEGGTELAKAAKTMGKVPAQCGTKAENATALDDGNEADPKGVLQAHRDAVSALRRVAVARVAVGALQTDFSKAWPVQEASIRAVDPKAAQVYKKAAADLDKDLKKVVDSLPATLYPTKGKAKAAKKDMVKKLKPIRAKNERGIAEFQRRHDELKAAHRAYPNTEDLGLAENSAWLAVEGARQVDAQDLNSGVGLLKSAETSLPALVIAGENAAEAYLESCDQWAAMKRLAKAAPAK